MTQKYELRLIGEYPFDEVASSLQKMIRRSKEYEAVYWAYIFHHSGYGQYLWRRLSIITCEDICNATPIAPVIVSSLQQSWLLLHKHIKEPTLDKFILAVQAVLFLCRAKKSRENDSLSCLIEENFKSGKRLEVDDVSLDSHTERGRAVFGSLGNLKDGKGKMKLDRWFNVSAYIDNEAYPDKWIDELKPIWYGRAEGEKNENK